MTDSKSIRNPLGPSVGEQAHHQNKKIKERIILQFLHWNFVTIRPLHH